MGLREDILAKIDVVSYYTSKLNFEEKKGKNWRSKCPFHSEKTGSFFVEIDSGRWFCQGKCKTGGDIISFHEKYNNQTFNEALRDLAKIAGVEIPDHGKSGKKKRGKRPSVPSLSDEMVEKMHGDLPESERSYLNQRGISNEVINGLRIGYSKNVYGGESMVFPVYRDGKLHNYRFYRRATERREKDIKQLSAKSLGHDPIWLFPEPDPDKDDVFLFEGEIDCMVALSLGLNATTVTGGAGTWRDEFAAFFEKKNVFICYDIDETGRIGSKTVGKHISKVAHEVRIVELDLDPDEYPKGDFNDYILSGKSIDDFLALAGDSNVLPVLDPGVEVSVVEDGGMYYSVRVKNNGDFDYRRITNFYFKLLCRYIVEEDDSASGWKVIREVTLINTRGEKSDPSMLDPDSISNAMKFRAFCVGRGRYQFEGSPNDIAGIMHLLEAQDRSAKVVREIPQVGESRKFGLWIFDNIAIKNGELIRPDERGIFWNGANGYKLAPFTTGGSAARGPDFIPSEVAEKNWLPDFCESLLENLGGENYDALFGVALAVGSIYSRDIIVDPRFACYPITFVYGTHTSGKTEFVSFLMRLFGMGRIDSESMPAITSTVPISRRLAYFSNIPIWIDEYRDNLNKSNMICGVLRNAYDGIGRSLGRKKFGVEKNDVRSTVIVSGEHLPSDEAFRSRLIPICINLHERKPEFHKAVLDYSRKSSTNVFEIMVKKNDRTRDELLEAITHYINTIRETYPQLNQRTAKNYAIALACYRTLVNPEDKILESYVTKVGVNAFDIDDVDSGDDIYLTDAMKDFFDTLSMAIESGELNKVAWGRIVNDKDTQSVYIHLPSLHAVYAKYYRMRTNLVAPSMKTVKSWFRTLPCFVKDNSVQRMRTNENNLSPPKKCIEFDIKRLPSHIFNIFCKMPNVTGECLIYNYGENRLDSPMEFVF